MSADNCIYIQQRGKEWWVWMGFLSDAKKPKPQKKDVHFLTYDEAFAYARGWLRGESVVEYGTILLEAIP